MTANKRAIDNTEDEFRAALATYTKAGNKTAAMRRLWNAAYEKGKMAVVAAEARRPVPTPEESRDLDIGAAKLRGFAEGQRAGFEEGRRVGEKGAMTVDAVELVFASGKADGMEIGREKENLRWKELGHFEDGTCRSVTSATDAGVEADPSSPFANTTDVMSVLTGFDWADDAESLPIHATLEKSIQHVAAAPYKTLWLSREYDPETELLLFTTSTVCTLYEQRAFGQQQFLVGSFGVGFGWRAVGNEDVALLRGVDAAVPGLLYPLHRDTAGSSLDQRQRIRPSYRTAAGSGTRNRPARL
ncbi:hypothetical protein B0H14DRAFT_3739743 [Mycena olivaceomarginata]|nr:hypothetical protein B0H14DRAFT_3739743 [Mycena olivaceomarginata]